MTATRGTSTTVRAARPSAGARARAVTLRDVAQQTGVTAATVSMALSGHPRISGATRERVKQAAAALGYVPSSAAKALRSQRAGAVAVIVPNSAQHVFGHTYFMHVLTGVTAVANEHDTKVLISTGATDGDGLTAYERVLRSGGVDGAVVTSAAHADPNIGRLRDVGLPVVLIGNYPELVGAHTTGVDDVAASAAVTEHLITVHGRTRLTHVSGPLDHQTALDRQEGFLAAVHRHGLAHDAQVLEGDFSEAGGAEATARALAARPRLDGVVYANDDMAFGGMSALRAATRSVPFDVAVVGFDDFGLSRLTRPGITSVHVPAEEMARRATEQLMSLVAGAGPPPHHTTLATSLVLRDSCGCPPAPPVLTRT